ncbi:MAG: exo-alpha-sialidase [Bacteroidaceae bacterium]|nr:exo-alpha-sialidase [Bacteroidaceae bacterium]
MKQRTLLILLLLLFAGAEMQLSAQTAVTVGSQVTDAANIVSGKAYVLRWDGLTGTPYALDNGGSAYSMANNNSPSQAAVYYFISDGNGGYKVENAYTGKYWPTPTSNNQTIAPTTAANAGTWTIAASGTANRFTFTCTVDATDYHTNRSSSKLVAHTTDSPVSIYEVTASTLATAATYSAFADKDISVSATEAASISEGQWYVLKNRGRNGYAFENSGSMKNQGAAPAGSATDNGKFLVRFLNAGDGKYYLQNGLSNFWGAIPQNTAVPATALGTEKYTIGKINSTDGHFYLTSETNGIVLDCQENGYPVVGWGTNIPTTTGGNSDWAFYPVEFVDSWMPAIDEVYTINNTNSGRGAMMYNGSSSYVWSSGKSGTFSATDPYCQWVLVSTGTAKQYYLYNVGADKFAIPSATTSTASWIFSSNAVAVTFITQNDGTKKIKTVTTDTYAAVSNNYTGPIINYNDVGGNFTITKVDGDASTAANAAVAKLVKNQTALTGAVTADDGWYVISIKTTGNSTATASPGRYVYPGTTNQANYPLTFTGGVDVQPAISDATFFTRFVKNGADYNWQMTNGQYLINRNNVFPTPSSEPAVVNPGYDNGNYIYASGRYADPYVSNGNFFIGETASYRTTWNIYPIDLDAAGLTAWQVLCDNAPESAQITCSRSDVSGLTAVYKNGFFFLPTGVTPESTDFNLDGATNVTLDATAKTVTFAYDPTLAIVADGVTVEQGWQTAGRDSEVMLLRVTAKPFKAATNTTLTVSLKDGSEANISTLKLYEANNNSPEIYSTGDGAPTKTEVATASISGSTATFNIGNLTAGTHYYWIGATVSSTATLGAVLDAAVTGIAYQVEGQTAQNLDLTSVGDPADRGAMVFNVRSYPFLPRDNGSRVYRIPAMIVADDGSIVVAADKRYQSHTDIGNGGHVIDIVVRRSTDGGKTWSAPVTIAKGEGSTASGGDDKRCGFGDPSLVKGKDGKLYCLFAAGNEGYFYGQKGMCMSVSTDNGVTWSSGEGNPPVDLYWSGAIKNVATAGAAGFGLYDYFVTSGRGLYIPEDDILMYLIPAQTMTSATEHTGDSQDYVFYSRDGGESWYFSDLPMVQGGDEAKIIQMNDGSLFGSIRKGGNRRFNTATYTKNDDGKTLSFNFGTQWDNSQLSQTHQNNQDIYYYQRETTEGKTDVIIHSITTGNHVNFKLFYSTDKGVNWTEFLNVQTKGTRYVTMDKNPANGSLYLLFEDQSLNSAGGYTDYNHYPLNFIEITRDQLVSLIPALEEYNVPEYLKTNVVKNTVYQTSTGCDSYGAFSGTGSGHWARTWTSNASSGMAGLTVSTESGYGFDKATVLGTRVMTIRPSANGATDTYTITAPAGYVISSYTIGGAVYTGGTYRITAADGTTTGDITSTTTPTNINVTDVNASSTTFTFYGASQNNWFAFTNFTITLAKTLPLNVVGDKSYATLYLPFDVTTTGATKAYYIETTNNGYAQLTATDNEGTKIPANTAVVLINSDADASTVLNMTTGLSSVVSESANLLKGTLVPMSLDLSDATPYYSLGRLNGEIGFYKFDNGGTTTITLGANKAYLDTTAPVGPVKGFIFSFEDDETGISEIVNGISSDSNWYNLSGQRLSRPQKGINIVNGKKVTIK